MAIKTNSSLKYSLHSLHKKQSNNAQYRQDMIFRKMSADRKIEIGSLLWRLAKDLVGDKIHYGTNRSKTSPNKNN